MITREQVADLKPGDVVELTWARGTTVRGPLTSTDYNPAGVELEEACWTVRGRDGNPPFGAESMTLTVVSRAPRPLYINHPRTLPVAGDVVGHDKPSGRTWFYAEDGFWRSTYTANTTIENHMPRGMRLLVDGSTGEVVQ